MTSGPRDGRKVGVIGVYGKGNLGDEALLLCIADDVRTCLPDAEILAICSDPEAWPGHDLLTAVADRPEAELRIALDQLVASELIFRRGAPPEATYSFKHTLVQDTAYQSLLKSKRQQSCTPASPRRSKSDNPGWPAIRERSRPPHQHSTPIHTRAT